MSDHTAIPPEEAADRLAIREIVDAYARCADRRDTDGQKALFTADTRFVVYMAGEGQIRRTISTAANRDTGIREPERV